MSGLAASVSYAGAGWLATTLSHTTAPAILTLQIRTANVTAGTYSASVRISGQGAASIVTLAATLIVQPCIVTVALAQTINGYRVSQGLSAIAVSRSLTLVAEKHVEDLEKDKLYEGACNAATGIDLCPR